MHPSVMRLTAFVLLALLLAPLLPAGAGHESAIITPRPALVSPDPFVHGRAPQTPRAVPHDEPALRARAAVGTETILVLIIEFQDVRHYSSSSQQKFQSLLFGQGDKDNSMYRYYQENSYGKFFIAGSVAAQWYLSDFNMSRYGADSSTGIDDANGPIYKLVTEAVEKADADTDFSKFDTDGDGFVDHLMVVHAGQGQESSLDRNTIWSHRWYDVDEPEADGVRVGGYTMLSEFSPLGTFAHEFGHDLGLPDLYDTDYDSYGVGVWDIMGAGSWLDRGNTPAHMSAWSKAALGWLQPVEATGPVSLPLVERQPFAVRLRAAGSSYFLLENRGQVGYDRYLPGAGLLIWHIDEAQMTNDDQRHKKVDLEEANATQPLDDSSLRNPGDKYDPWYDSVTGFTPFSSPGSNNYDGTQTGWKVYNISAWAETMTAIVGLFDDDVAVEYLAAPAYADVSRAVEVRAGVANGGRSPAENIALVFSVTSGGRAVENRTLNITYLDRGQTVQVNLTWRPNATGTYLLNLSLTVADDNPANDWKARLVRVTTTLFYEDAERGDNGWAHYALPPRDDLWHITNATSVSPDHSWWAGVERPGGGGRLPSRQYLESPYIDLRRASSATLLFFQRYDLTTGLPYPSPSPTTASIEVSTNGGITWGALGSYTGAQRSWETVNYDLDPYTGHLVKMRFGLDSRGLVPQRGWWIDDIFVIGETVEANFSIALSRSDMQAAAGDPVSATLFIANFGSAEDDYRVEVYGPSGWWTAAAPLLVTVPPLATREAAVDILPPGMLPANSTGTIRVYVSSLRLGGGWRYAEALVSIVPSVKLSVQLPAGELSLVPGKPVAVTATVRNAGNAPATVLISLSGQPAGWSVAGHESLLLGPFSDAAVTVTVTPPPDAPPGPSGTLTLTASAPGQKASASISASVLVLRSAGLAAPARVEVRAGGEVNFTVQVTNSGNTNDTVYLSWDAPAGFELSASPSTALRPGEAATLIVNLNASSATPRGGRLFLMLTASTSGMSAAAAVRMEIVLLVPDIRLTTPQKAALRVPEGREALVNVVVTNAGRAESRGVVLRLTDGSEPLGRGAVIGDISAGSGVSYSFHLSLRPGYHLLTVTAISGGPDADGEDNTVQVWVRVVRAGAAVPGFEVPLLLLALIAVALAASRRREP